jgi:FkbM family methyltransferase
VKWRFLYRAFKARYRDQRHEIKVALHFLRPGVVAADIGANKGAYLYWLRKAVGAGGRVFAYEPQSSLAVYLHDVCAALDWDNVLIRDCALSDSPGTRSLHVPGTGDSPGASLERPADGVGLGRSHECQVDTLDRQLLGVDDVALLKVDVEGHELQVFRGAQRVLSRHRPVLLFECEARHLGQHTMQDVFSFLHGFDYEGAFFSPRGLRPLGQFDARIHQRQTPGRFWDAPDYCNNFLFLPQDKSPGPHGWRSKG